MAVKDLISKAELNKKLARGMSYGAIARELGVSKSSVFKLAKSHDAASKHPKPTFEEREEMPCPMKMKRLALGFKS